MKWGDSMGKSQRDKGIRAERALVRYLSERAIDAHRMPLSGAMKYYKGDVVIPEWFGDEAAEVKFDGHVPMTLYQWLENRPALFMRRSKHPWLITMQLIDFIEMLQNPKRKLK